MDMDVVASPAISRQKETCGIAPAPAMPRASSGTNNQRVDRDQPFIVYRIAGNCSDSLQKPYSDLGSESSHFLKSVVGPVEIGI